MIKTITTIPLVPSTVWYTKALDPTPHPFSSLYIFFYFSGFIPFMAVPTHLYRKGLATFNISHSKSIYLQFNHIIDNLMIITAIENYNTYMYRNPLPLKILFLCFERSCLMYKWVRTKTLPKREPMENFWRRSLHC